MQRADAVLARGAAESFAAARTRVAELEALGEEHREREADRQATTATLNREVTFRCVFSQKAAVVRKQGKSGVLLICCRPGCVCILFLLQNFSAFLVSNYGSACGHHAAVGLCVDCSTSEFIHCGRSLSVSSSSAVLFNYRV